MNQKSRFAIVVGRFNELVSRALLDGALETFERSGVMRSSVDVFWVPGAFELPLAAKKAATSGKYIGVVCLGCVIRGETPHFDYVAGQAASGIMKISLDHEMPVVFGLLTTDNIEQALSRSGLKGGNKGRDAAATALEMVHVLRQIDDSERKHK